MQSTQSVTTPRKLTLNVQHEGGQNAKFEGNCFLYFRNGQNRNGNGNNQQLSQVETEVRAEEEKVETDTCGERENSLKGDSTGCVSHFRNLALFNNLKEPMLVKKPTILQKKALILNFLELQGQGLALS